MLKFLIFLIVILSASQAEVRVVTLDNQIYRGELIAVTKSPNLSLVLRVGDQEQRIDCLNIVEVVYQDRVEVSELPCISLVDDSRLYGEIVSGDENVLCVNSTFAGPCDIELTSIKEIVFQNKGEFKPSDPENDVVYFTNGDVMTGLICRFGKGYVEIEHSQLGTRKEYLENISRISFAQMESIASSTDLSAKVLSIDNSELRGDIIGVQGEKLILYSSALKRRFEIDLGRIQRFFFLNARFVYLSDLPKDQYQVKYTPFFGDSGEMGLPRMDRNQRGGPICLSRRIHKDRPSPREKLAFYKGIGVFARTEIRVNLGKNYRLFQSHIGVDDAIRSQAQDNPYSVGGSVVFRIYVDGKKSLEAAMDWESDFTMVEVDLTGKEELVLEVDYGDNANMNDLANWAGARLVKKQ